MLRALELARRAWGRTHPNPMVGAVITEGGRVVAEGFHEAAGGPHAEVAALRALGRRPAADAVLHVTLEPCCTHGRTPPCVEAIVSSGIRTVVVGARDPNPAHAGKGLDLLRQAGVAVVEGVLAEECADLNLIFNHWIVTRRPLMTLKVASTIDGLMVPAPGMPREVTGPEARADVHRWRRLFPAVAVSVDTLLADNPRLTARDEGPERCPTRFVLDRRFRSAGRSGLRLFSDHHRDRTVVVGLESELRAADAAWYESEGVRLWTLPGGPDEFLSRWSERCASEGVTGVLIEGGPRLSSALLDSGFVDMLFAYVAPRLGGDPAHGAWFGSSSLGLGDVKVIQLGKDVFFRGTVSRAF
ncbi:MAG: Riboflavin biosynthesis protein RibD [Verrucomicrobiota bacterium]|jgi:diaminohydroxyphosphoribosylaminopyrimidine deaminase/5-amino-6-(5-phosphoribosylamino)uracil reductase